MRWRNFLTNPYSTTARPRHGRWQNRNLTLPRGARAIGSVTRQRVVHARSASRTSAPACTYVLCHAAIGSAASASPSGCPVTAPHAPLAGSNCHNNWMRFQTKLDVAIRRGHLALTDGGISVPPDADIQFILPSCRSAAHSTFRRAMWRSGYAKRGHVWYQKTLTSDLSKKAQHHRYSQRVCHRRSGPPGLLEHE